MIYLLDTNAFSDYVREHPQVAAHLAALVPPDRVFTCMIVLGEVLHGIERLPTSRKRQDLEQKTTRALTICRCKPFPADTAQHYARTKAQLQRAGLPLDENDLWIAAMALAIDATLITRDEHFRRVPALRLEDWSR